MNDCQDPWAARNLPDTSPVPPAYRGVWVRTLLETPDLRDDTTFVRWMQLGRWHADLRVPEATLTDRAALPADQLTAAQRALLATQQGFCGVTEVTTRAGTAVCCWHRLVDYQPPGPSPDAGVMVFETPDRVIETGVHGVYREVWQRLPLSTGLLFALAEPPRVDGQASARIFRAGQYLMRVRPLPVPGPEFEISFGTLDPHDSSCWQIQRSTCPELEGQAVTLRVSRQDDDSALVEHGSGSQAWAVLEWSEEA